MTQEELCKALADWQGEDVKNRTVAIVVSDRKGDSRKISCLLNGEKISIIRMLVEAMGHDSQFRYVIERSVAVREILRKIINGSDE